MGAGDASGYDLIERLRRMGLLKAAERARLTPLTGGVSSDIVLVEADGRRFCVKRALPRLKVAALWEAPVERNAAEAAWMRAVARWLPRAVPRILGEDAEAGLFAMEYLAPEDHPLMEDSSFSPAASSRISPPRSGAISPSSMRGAPPTAASGQPSPTTTRSRRSASSPTCARPAAPTLSLRRASMRSRARRWQTKRALVHGDVSPKNILHGPRGPVFLDAECAWFGDPAFDLAFCLNHLLLKGARAGADRTRYIAAFSALAGAYLAGSRLGGRRRPRSARCRAAAGALPRQGRRQVAGRVPHPRERAGGRAPRRRAADRRSAASS